MTPDIVKRLRAQAAQLTRPADEQLMLEAAKKIGWLRREVYRLTEELELRPTGPAYIEPDYDSYDEEDSRT